MSGSTQRKITQPEFYKLCTYLESRRADLTNNSYTLVNIAHQASTALKMPIGPKTVGNALDTIDLTLKETPRQTGSQPLWGSIRALAKAHVQLCRDLGNNCPPEIELLAQSE